jgi:hypothetical protein
VGASSTSPSPSPSFSSLHFTLQDLFAATAASLDIDPLKDAFLQRVLTCACYRLIDYVSSDWAAMAPTLLGTLRDVAEALPHGVRLADVYPDPNAPFHSPTPSPSPDDDTDVDLDDNFDEDVAHHHDPPVVLPPFISNLYALRNALVDAKDVPPACANAIENAADHLFEQRSNFQRNYNASDDLRDAAERSYLTAHSALSIEILLADKKLMRRHANFDRLVLLLREGSFFTHFPFDVDSESFDNYQPYDGWRTSSHPSIYEMLME